MRSPRPRHFHGNCYVRLARRGGAGEAAPESVLKWVLHERAGFLLRSGAGVWAEAAGRGEIGCVAEKTVVVIVAERTTFLIRIDLGDTEQRSVMEFRLQACERWSSWFGRQRCVVGLCSFDGNLEDERIRVQDWSVSVPGLSQFHPVFSKIEDAVWPDAARSAPASRPVF